MKNKAQVNKLTGFALTLVVFAVVLAVGLSVLSNLRLQECEFEVADGNCLNSTGGTSYDGEESASMNATTEMSDALGTVPGWIPVIIVAMVGGIVLFLVIRQFSQ